MYVVNSLLRVPMQFSVPHEPLNNVYWTLEAWESVIRIQLKYALSNVYHTLGDDGKSRQTTTSWVAHTTASITN